MAPSPILYVEDEENDVLLVRLSFEAAQVAAPLRVVGDGREAIEYLGGSGRYADREQHPLPCLVLLDLNLPFVDGFEVLSWIREQEALKEMAVVIFSSSTLDQDKEHALALGASGYIVKPVNMARMEETTREINQRYVKARRAAVQD